MRWGGEGCGGVVGWSRVEGVRGGLVGPLLGVVVVKIIFMT